MAIDPQQVPLHRYVTTDNIHAGDIILEEEPWMWSLFCLGGAFRVNKPERMVCHYCLLSPSKLQACSACKSAWYCGPECQRADWDLRHKHGDCRLKKAIASKVSVGNANAEKNLDDLEFFAVIRRLLLSSASARLFSVKQRNSNGGPDSPLWNSLLKSASKTTDGWVNAVDQKPVMTESKIYADLVQMITWKDLPDKLIKKRILPSLVLLHDYKCWKNFVQESAQLPAPLGFPKWLALGACLEMSKFPNDCNPNAIIANEGRVVRMIAVEDIPNLDAVRLTRCSLWFEPRYRRRTQYIGGFFGYDCYCARCCGGDSKDTMLFALRCPKWAALYDGASGTSSGCDGIVSGMRRDDTDVPLEILSQSYDAEVAAVIDDPRPLSAEMAKKPAHERAECQKCHARYDQEVMDRHILPCLRLMTWQDSCFEDHAPISFTMNVRTCEYAETYIHPTYFFSADFEHKLIAQLWGALKDGTPLNKLCLMWMQRSAQRFALRTEGRGFKNTDVYELFLFAGLYSCCAQSLQSERRRLGDSFDDYSGRELPLLYEQTAELLTRVAMAVISKLRPLFIRASNEGNITGGKMILGNG